jgi:hypothetical protein
MTRLELIQKLIDTRKYEKYLEIGVNTPAQPGYVHDGLVVHVKHGVDPNVDTTFRMTSDEFFSQNQETYDIIFIDGLHVWEQVYRDIDNSLKILNEGGIIIVHDCNPREEIHQRDYPVVDIWNGSVWKAIAQLRLRDDCRVVTLDMDEGCALVTKEKNDTWQYFSTYRNMILNLVSPEEYGI